MKLNNKLIPKSKIYLCGIARYEDYQGTLKQSWKALTLKDKVEDAPTLAIDLESQLFNCFEQISHLDFQSLAGISIYSPSDEVNQLLSNQSKQTKLLGTKIDSKVISTSSQTDSVTKAITQLNSRTNEIAIVVDTKIKQSIRNTSLIVLCQKMLDVPKLVELKSMFTEDSIVSKNLLFDQEDRSSNPGIIGIKDSSLLPKIEDALAKQSKQKFCGGTALQTDLQNDGLIPGIIAITLSILTKTMTKSHLGDCADSLKDDSFLYTVERPRPWLQPQTITNRSARVAWLVTKEQGQETFIHLEENLDFKSETYGSLAVSQNTVSELVCFGASSKQELLENIDLISQFLAQNPDLRLIDLAFTINCNYLDKEDKFRLALIAKDTKDLGAKLVRAKTEIESGATKIVEETAGLYYRDENSQLDGKVAYLLPGLGSSYVSMLEELYHIHPTTQIAFDTLDSLALDYPESGSPSRCIYPAEKTSGAESTSLIEADFAVTSVLISSFALDSILKEANLYPDAYLGLSTGELGTYILNGYTSIEQAAPLFYKINIDVSKSIPKEAIANLATANVFCSIDRVKEIVEESDLPIFVIADLGPEHVMITGESSAIVDLNKLLKQANIVALNLAAPIPYHTPLVEKTLSEKVVKTFSQSLDFSTINIPSWSCSIAQLAPTEAKDIESLAKNMFKRPIRLKETVESMYKNGVRQFIEVGPNGILTSKVKEILHGKDYIAMASNLSNRSSITQIHQVIGALYTNGRNPDLTSWYQNRNAKQIDNLESNNTLPQTQIVKNDPVQSIAIADKVVKTYFDNLNALHQSTIKAQTELLDSYVKTKTLMANPTLNRSFLPAAGKDEREIACLSWLQFDHAKSIDMLDDMHLTLNFTEAEYSYIKNNLKSKKRKFEHIAGRLAAKDAVANLAEKLYSVKLQNPEIEILNDSKGKPSVKILNSQIKDIVFLSIAHSSGLAVALTIFSNQNLVPGIDLELIRNLDSDLPEFVLTVDEMKNLSLTYPDETEKNRQFLRLWTAKEAAYKAWGGDALSQYHWSNSNSEITKLSFDGKSIEVKTLILGNYIVSYTLVEKVSQQTNSNRAQMI